MIQPQHKKSESKDLFVIQHFTQDRVDRELVIEEETDRQTRHTIDVNNMKKQNLLGLVEVEQSPESKLKSKVDEPIVEAIEEEPDIISINEENLAPDENIDGYLDELRDKYHELSQVNSPTKTRD